MEKGVYIVESGEELKDNTPDEQPEKHTAIAVNVSKLNAKLDALLKANGIDPSSVG